MTTRTLNVPTAHHFAAQSDHARDFGDLQRAKARIAELEAEVARLKAGYIGLIDDTSQIHEALGFDKGSPIDANEILSAIALLKVDAERYRWLRDPCSGAERVIFYCRGDFGKGLSSGAMLDDAIDAALAARKGA